jgi:hypothetical protein
MYSKLVNQIIEGFSYSFDPSIFVTVRGCENVHIYLWMLKDLGWMLDHKEIGITFGTFALLWLFVLGYNARKHANNEELYFILPTFLWLFGNYLWMISNVFHHSDVYRFPASCFFMLALVSIVLYFGFLKNKLIFQLTKENSNLYSSHGLTCRFKSIGSWRRYEFVHMFFWCLKDYCWCAEDELLWIVGGAIPTLLISLDLIYRTWKSSSVFVDLMHYIAQLIWLSANIIWGYMEIFEIDSDRITKTSFSDPLKANGREIATFIILVAWIPIVLLYLLWIPLTLMKKIKSLEELENEKNHKDDDETIEMNPLLVVADPPLETNSPRSP